MTTPANVQVKDSGGTWKTATGVSVKVGGYWFPAAALWVKQGGVWVQVY